MHVALEIGHREVIADGSRPGDGAVGEVVIGPDDFVAVVAHGDHVAFVGTEVDIAETLVEAMVARSLHAPDDAPGGGVEGHDIALVA